MQFNVWIWSPVHTYSNETMDSTCIANVYIVSFYQRRFCRATYTDYRYFQWSKNNLPVHTSINVLHRCLLLVAEQMEEKKRKKKVVDPRTDFLVELSSENTVHVFEIRKFE